MLSSFARTTAAERVIASSLAFLKKFFCFCVFFFLFFFSLTNADTNSEESDNAMITIAPESGTYKVPLNVYVASRKGNERGEKACDLFSIAVNGQKERTMREEEPLLLREIGFFTVKAQCLIDGKTYGEQNQATFVLKDDNNSDGDDNDLLAEETSKIKVSAKRLAGIVFLGIFLGIAALLTCGVCSSFIKEFRGEFNRGAREFRGPGVGGDSLRRRSTSSSRGGSAQDFVNWFERNRDRALSQGSRLLSEMEMSDGIQRASSSQSNSEFATTSEAGGAGIEFTEFTLDDPDAANKRD